MKSLKWLLIFSLLFIPIASLSAEKASAVGGTSDELILNLKNNVMVHNGASFKSVQPLTLTKGTTFVAFSSIAQRYGYTISYDAKKKESIATSSKNVIRFKIGNVNVWKDGTSVKASNAPYVLNGSLMIPLRAWSQVTDSKLVVSGGKMTLSWNVKQVPTANFEVVPAEIYAEQTIVSYVDKSTNPSGQPFIDERWDGRMDIFYESGIHTITRQVQDINGVWSEPYSVTIDVRPPNQAPVADFTTEKTEYRIGEKILYTDASYDDENAIVSTVWTGNEVVFFEAGDKTVTLEVKDRHGLTSTITKTITVTSEVLYTKEEFERLFKDVGDKFEIAGSSVPGFEVIPLTFQSDTAQLVRSNSPETLIEEGIAYQDQITGQVRFMFHHMNRIGYPVKMYLIATNMSNSTVNVNTSSIGMGGPDPYVVNAGKFSSFRYLQSWAANESPKWTTVGPKQSVVILPEVSKVPIKDKQVFTAYADIFSDAELQYSVVFVEQSKKPLVELPNLKILPRDNLHTRGTFNGANRTIEINETVGLKPQRITLGDGKIDTYLDGIDYTNGELQMNFGNFAVLYKMKLRVAPNTLIALNGRGGEYTGAFMVNGNVVKVTETSILKNNNEAAVLYRTGDREETVEIIFTPSSGSNLPVAMMFLPLPELRW